MEAIDVQEPMERSGDLLIGKGCAKGLCQIYEAIIVVDLSAKTIHCGIVATTLKPKYRKYSESPKNFPAELSPKRAIVKLSSIRSGTILVTNSKSPSADERFRGVKREKKLNRTVHKL